MRRRGIFFSRQQAMPKNHSKGPFNKVVRANGLRCAICGRFTHFPTVDHIKPRDVGGTNDVSNLQLLCWPCHMEKDNKPGMPSHVMFRFWYDHRR